MKARGIQPPPVVDEKAKNKIDELIKTRGEKGIGRFKGEVTHG